MSAVCSSRARLAVWGVAGGGTISCGGEGSGWGAASRGGLASFCCWATFKCTVCGSGWAGVAVPLVTSIRTRSGHMMSIPIKQGGDCSPTITIKQAWPRASPHCRSKCCVLPAILSDFPWAPCTTPPNGFKGPHWARYRHHTENPMQVTEAPVSTRPRTGMPSIGSWPVMGGPTAHPTWVTLASGDPPSRLNAPEGDFGRHLPREVAPRLVLLEGRQWYRSLAGALSAVGLSEPGSGT